MTPSTNPYGPATEATLETLLATSDGSKITVEKNNRGSVVLLVLDKETRAAVGEIRDLMKELLLRLELGVK